MNIAEVIQDALRGRSPRREARRYGPGDPTAPEEFLETRVWPLLKEARYQLETRRFSAIAVRPEKDDPTHRYALIILDSPCQRPGHACFLRFLILEGKVCVSVKNAQRTDPEPLPLEPPGSLVLVEDLIRDFIFQCLMKSQRYEPAPKEPARDTAGGLDLSAAY
jgi:hypothetical protein